MRIYILFSVYVEVTANGSCLQRKIVGVFSTYEAATVAAKKEGYLPEGAAGNGDTEFNIEEFELQQ